MSLRRSICTDSRLGKGDVNIYLYICIIEYNPLEDGASFYLRPHITCALLRRFPRDLWVPSRLFDEGFNDWGGWGYDDSVHGEVT